MVARVYSSSSTSGQYLHRTEGSSIGHGPRLYHVLQSPQRHVLPAAKLVSVGHSRTQVVARTSASVSRHPGRRRGSSGCPPTSPPSSDLAHCQLGHLRSGRDVLVAQGWLSTIPGSPAAAAGPDSPIPASSTSVTVTATSCMPPVACIFTLYTFLSLRPESQRSRLCGPSSKFGRLLKAKYSTIYGEQLVVASLHHPETTRSRRPSWSVADKGRHRASAVLGVVNELWSPADITRGVLVVLDVDGHQDAVLGTRRVCGSSVTTV